MVDKPYLVGIVGGSGSGKTSFLKELSASLPSQSMSILSQDNYYLPIENQQKDENGEVNFDLPTAVNRQKFHQDLNTLLQGDSIQMEEYTFNNSNAPAKSIEVQSRPIIIMEGLFVFHFEEIRKALDLRVFLEVNEEEMLQRRLKRDFEERGYPEDVVRYQWENHVLPSYQQYLLPYKEDSHITIHNQHNYHIGLEVLSNHLKSKLSLQLS